MFRPSPSSSETALRPEAQPRRRALGRLRAAFAAPLALLRWHRRDASAASAAASLPTPDASPSFFHIEEDEPRGEVSLYPMQIDSECPSEMTAHDSNENTDPERGGGGGSGGRGGGGGEGAGGSVDCGGGDGGVSVDIVIDDDGGDGSNTSDVSRDRRCGVAPETLRPQVRMLVLPAAPVAVAVARCVCWALAQSLVRQALEKAVGAAQRWLFANVCSRRTRLAVIGALSVVWGMFVGAVAILGLFVIINGDLERLVEEAAQLGQYHDVIAASLVAWFLVLHVAQVLCGALLIAASKVAGYRPPEVRERLLEKLLLGLFEMLKIDLTPPPPAPCNHSPAARSPSTLSDGGAEAQHCREPVAEQPGRSSSIVVHPPPLSWCLDDPDYVHVGWYNPSSAVDTSEQQMWPALPDPWVSPVFHGGHPPTSSSNTINPTPANVSPSVPGNIPYSAAGGSNTGNFPYQTADVVSCTTYGKLPYPVPHIPERLRHPSEALPTLPQDASRFRSLVGKTLRRAQCIAGLTPPNVRRNLQACPWPALGATGRSRSPRPPRRTVKVRTRSSPLKSDNAPANSTESSWEEKAVVGNVIARAVSLRVVSRQVRGTEGVPARSSTAGTAGSQALPTTGPSPVPHMLLPWLYVAWATLAGYALLASGLGALGRGAVAASVGAVQLPAVACIMDVFAELRGVPETCGCKEFQTSAERTETNITVMSSPDEVRRFAASPRTVESDHDERSPLLL